MTKKLLALVLCLLMAMSLLPVGALAEEEGEEDVLYVKTAAQMGGSILVEGPIEDVNTLITDVETENEIYDFAPLSEQQLIQDAMDYDGAVYTSIAAAGKAFRASRKKHETSVTIVYRGAASALDTSTERQDAVLNIWNESMKMTADPMEGDYIRHGWYSRSISWSSSTSGSSTDLTISYRIVYWGELTYSQEQQMASAANSIINSFGFTSKTSGYDKIKKIYDWIGTNIRYDYDGTSGEAARLNQTAYSAIINRKTICAGYSHLMYYMMWKCGIPARIISGTGGTTSNRGNHAWNMVWLRGQWYSMDVTWDEGKTYNQPASHDWFLRGKNSGFYNASSGYTHFTNRDSEGPDPYPYTTLVNASSSSNYGSRRAADNGQCTAHTNASSTYKTENGEVVYWCSACGQSKVGSFGTVTALTLSSVSASKTTAKVGDTITWTAKATGGSGTLKYCFYILRDGATVQKGSYGTANTVKYKITDGGSYSVKAFVKDGSGTSVNKTGGQVNINSGTLAISSFGAERTAYQPGETITWTVSATGGTGTVQYCFYILKDGAVVKKGAYGSAVQVSYKASTEGVYAARVFVKDAAGEVLKKDSANVTVSTPQPITVTSAKANKSTASAGETVTWTAYAKGGVGTLKYCFYVLKDGQIVQKGSYGTTKSISYQVTSTGEYSAKVFVKDDLGDSTSQIFGNCTVTAATPITITAIKTYQTSPKPGDTITWTASAKGGSGSLQYCFYVLKNGEVIEKGTYGTESTYSYKVPMKLTESVTYEVKVFVKDNIGTKASKIGGAAVVAV